jgi:hypothetical protein
MTHASQTTLYNSPHALRHFERDGEIVDLAVVDVVHTRRRGVPRYNDFRAGLHMPRINAFEDLTTDPDSLAALKRLYRSVDEVDTVVGLLAEEPPAGCRATGSSPWTSGPRSTRRWGWRGSSAGAWPTSCSVTARTSRGWSEPARQHLHRGVMPSAAFLKAGR